jgi:hypothetical protein
MALRRMRWVRSIQAAAGLVQLRPSDIGKMTVSSNLNLLSAPEGGKFAHTSPHPKAPSWSSTLISSALRAGIEPNEVTIGSLMAAL